MIGVVLQPIQESLREMIGIVGPPEMIGVVPLATNSFNDIICTNITYGKRDAVHSELDKVVVSAIICSLSWGWDILVVIGD